MLLKVLTGDEVVRNAGSAPTFNLLGPNTTVQGITPNLFSRVNQSDPLFTLTSGFSATSVRSFEGNVAMDYGQSRDLDGPTLDDLVCEEKDIEEYKCPICMQILQSPRQCKNGHLYCALCIQKSLDKRAECPQCRVPLNLSELAKSLVAEKHLRALKVHCKYYLMREESKKPAHNAEVNWIVDPEGCQETFTQEEAERHESKCGYAPDLCMFGANCRVRKMTVEEHRDACPYRTITCDHCKKEIKLVSLEDHNVKCPEIVIHCELCQAEMKRGHLREHRRQQCPEEDIPCAYSEQGCDAQVKRKQMPRHMEESAASHLARVSQHLSQQLFQMSEDFKQSLKARDDKIRSLERALADQNFDIDWKMKNWSSLKKKSYLQSGEFELAGLKWYMGIYPNGDLPDARGHISLFLFLSSNCRGQKVGLRFSLRIMNHRNPNTKIVQNGFRANFPLVERPEEQVSKGWGAKRFTPCDEITEANGYLKDDLLFIQASITVCNIRWEVETANTSIVGYW
ncbi:hypothetical protein PROFUN_01198 [Planoprotostelium fungivorum]|uniref:Uncharacterized protein n=1 Tax=Planoprotostelium fungivorum TaxID=1890364 RepID=A0A2P6NCJ5_9EUKA|nr:hypothetical protein PROFUN_01198 [Planoprotostelium fungivorum]